MSASSTKGHLIYSKKKSTKLDKKKKTEIKSSQSSIAQTHIKETQIGQSQETR